MAVGWSLRVCSFGCDLELRDDGSDCTVMETLLLFVGGLASLRAAASCALRCNSVVVGWPRFFLVASLANAFEVGKRDWEYSS
jgi:hypothetical protein